jgi:septation ring formation regulator EzrA
MVDMTVLITVSGFAISAVTFFIGRMTAAKNSGAIDGEMKADIKHIKETQSELKDDIKTYGMNYTEVCKELESIKGRVAKLEEIVRIYHEGDSV